MLKTCLLLPRFNGTLLPMPPFMNCASLRVKRLIGNTTEFSQASSRVQSTHSIMKTSLQFTYTYGYIVTYAHT